MLVGICGYGYTGSGAVLDYLEERDECDTTIKFEFNLAYTPHGLQDLEYHLTKQISRYYSSDAAIKDFLRLVNKLYATPRSVYRKASGNKFRMLSYEYIKKITQITWRGWWTYDMYYSNFIWHTLRYRLLLRYIRFWEKKHKRKFGGIKSEKMYLSIYPPNFEKETRRYIQSLLEAFGCDNNKIIVLNQPFEANAPQNSMKYYKNARAIIVDRDPRDLYLLIKKVILDAGAFVPSDDVYKFIRYYRLCRIEDEQDDNSKILHINFEDMIYEYESTIHRINAFLNMDDTGKNKYQHFSPQVSINNTQLHLRYPELSDEVKIIEKELPEYLYPFEKYCKKPDGNFSF